MSELANLTSKDKKVESQSHRKKKRILIPEISHVVTSMWARKPNIKLAKIVFANTRLDFDQGVVRGFPTGSQL